MSDRENSEMEIEEGKETDTRTESTTSMEETEGQDTELGTREADDRTDWRHKRDHPRDNATQMRHERDQSGGHPVRTGVANCQYYLKGRCFFGRSCRYNHSPRNQMVQRSAYQVRLGATNCEQYLQTGQCNYGRKCWFNHPSIQLQMRHEMVQPSSPYPGAKDCEQYLQKGQCSYGRMCRFNHPPAPYFEKGGCKHGSSFQYVNSLRGDGVEEPMRQATTWVRRSDEMRHGTESSSRTEKRARTIPYSLERDVVAGQNSWLQRRRQAQESVLSLRGNIDCGKRRESEEERTLRERQARDLEEQKQKKRKEETLRIDQVKHTVQTDEGRIQTEERLEIPENLQEEEDMERQKREAQGKAQEKRSRSVTDNVDYLRQFLQDIGIERKEGDGF